MAKFQVDDEVVSYCYPYDRSKGVVGIVRDFEDSHLLVQWPDGKGSTDGLYFCSDFELRPYEDVTYHAGTKLVETVEYPIVPSGTIVRDSKGRIVHTYGAGRWTDFKGGLFSAEDLSWPLTVIGHEDS